MAEARKEGLEPPLQFRPQTPVVIGLTGGVAAGKSAVARLFAAHGLVPVCADAHARAVSAEPQILAEIVAAFGPDMVSGGRLDRERMAQKVFADGAARAQLEAILHPPTRRRILLDLAAIKARGDSALLDAPLLIETGLVEFCSGTVHIETTAATRRQRAATRGWAAGELERREAAQLPLAMKKQRAMHTIGNDGDLAETAQQVAAVIARLATAFG